MDSFWTLAAAEPSHIAVVEPDGRTLTAGELLASSNRLVHGLRAFGLVPGDTIAVAMKNRAALLELYMAATQAGFYFTPINIHLAAPEIAYIVADCEAKAFFYDERTVGALGVIDLPRERCFSADELGRLTEGQLAAAPSDRRAGLVMTYTSGTTGKPKGVRRPLPPAPPEAVAGNLAAFLSLFGIGARGGAVHLVVSPLYHTAVLSFCTNHLHLGHTMVLMDKWTPEGMLALVERHRVTATHMVPTQFRRLLALSPMARAQHDLSSLRHVIHSAAPCPVDVKRDMLAWWGRVIYEYYAASEGGGTLVRPEEWLAHPGTVGRAWPISKLRIVREDGSECMPGEPGVVYMSMGAHRFEYHKDRAKTDASWKGDYFTVGDVGYLDAEGYLFLCDRKSDMIISGGVNIYPAEIESVLGTHPKVGDVAVFGIPDEDWGEQVKAVIEPAAGVEPDSSLTAELLAFCSERLAAFKIPRSIDFVPTLPRDPNGKLYKRTLRDPYWAGRERAI